MTGTEDREGGTARRETGSRRRGRRGGSGHAGDTQTPASAPYIARRIRPYEFLSEEGLAAVEDHADRLLAEVGMEFRNDAEALALWREAGAEVDGERVRFAPGMLRGIIQASAPREFTQHARNPARSVRIGGDNTVFSPAYGAPFVRGLAQGRRYAGIEDFRNFVKLAYMSPWLHHSGGTICEPVDVPVNKRHLDMVHSHIRYSDKAFLGSITTAERAADSIEMARIVFGHDFAENNCVIMGNVNVNSPLVFDGTVTEPVKTYARANQGIVITPFILGGAMGPVTTSGALAQAFAEAMAGVAFVQLVRPGAPAVLGCFLSSMSLRSGAPTFGMPEPAMAYLAIGQLARRLGVPLRCGGALTASKIPDAQAAQESADSLLPTVIGGANFVMHSAGWLEGGLTMGYEKFVMDADHLGMMHVLAGGLSLDENGFALDAFKEVGPGKHFLGSAHTMANYRDAFYISEIADSDSFEQWQDAGGKDAVQRAHERCNAMLATYEPPPLDEATDEALRAFIEQRREAVADSWY
jgi:trimethylamine--corrinoid protein Co-methyltransferase